MRDDLAWAGLPEPGDPALAEWLEGASCGPHVKALAVRAADAAGRGVSAARWRHDLLAEHPDAAALLAEAEECMRGAGLWPWQTVPLASPPRTADMTTPAAKAAGVRTPGRALIAARTLRADRWWAYPLTTFTVLLAFIAYATYAAIANRDYYAAPYLSPFYSPCLSFHCGTVPGSAGAPHLGWFGTWWIVTPAVIILIFPLGFRLTSYYYRKAYYRSWWMSPPACAVPEPHRRYTGETRFPLLGQNIHRYFFYAALAFNVIFTWDAVVAFDFGGHIGIGVGRWS